MKKGQVSAGHPVDVATGVVYSTHEDYSIPGKVDLIWERSYSTALLDRPATFLGPGWTSRYFATLTRAGSEYQFYTPEGNDEIFADPDSLVETGGVARNLGTFQELTKRSGDYIVTRWDVDAGEIDRYVFNEGRPNQAWPLASIEDVSGQALDMLRDESGRLLGIRQRLEKRTLVLHYTEGGRIDSVSFLMPDDRLQSLVRYEYDQTGRLVTAYDALDYADHYEYDKSSRMTREIVKDGGVFFFRYDDRGRCIFTSATDRYDEKTLRYFDFGFTELTDSMGSVTRFQWLPSGQITGQWNPLGAETRTEYDDHGRIAAITSPTGATTQFAYDEQGNRSKIVDPLGNAYLQTFREPHLATVLIDPKDNQWKRYYDEGNRLVATEDPQGGRWALQYDAAGNLVALTNPKGDVRTFRYAEGLLTEETDWKGNPTSVQLDAFGRIAATLDALGYTYRYEYDAAGNRVRVVMPDGAQYQAAYDAGGNLIQLTDPVGRVTTQRFGPCRRLLERVDANGNKVSYTWGTEPGRLESVVNERGEVFRLFYSASGHRIREISFDGREHQFAYNASGWCIQMTNGAGETIAIGRDPVGRILSMALPGGNLLKYAYDALGNLVEAANPECAVRLERDSLGNITRDVQSDHWVKYTRDPLGEVTRVETDLGHEVRYDLDANGIWDRLRTGDGHTMLFRRDAEERELERWLPGGLRLHQRYDTVGRLIEQHVGPRDFQPTRPGPSAVSAPSLDGRLHRTYIRDPSGLIQEIDDQYSGTTRYTYDPERRLLNVLRDRGPAETFDYDDASNLSRLVTEKNGSTQDEELAYGPGNRLLSMGSTQQEYDGQGRLVRKTEATDTAEPRTWSYGWDALDQLSSVTRPDGEEWHYGYDALGRRVRKTGPNDELRFIWNGDVPAHEISTRERNWKGWIFGQDSFSPLAQIEGSSIYSVIEDHLGTPQEMVDQSGRIVWRLRVRAYGEKYEEAAAGTSCPFRFQGQYYDPETELHYNRFRYYDPTVGRFISQDPIGLVAGENLYQYAPNPTAWIDPWGWVNAPATLPNTPGIYTITNGNDCYVGSAGIGQQGMSDRISDPSHTKAQDLLGKPGTVVEYKEVDLGTANSDKARNRILRHFEQQEMDTQEANGKKLSNGCRAEAEKKNARNAKIVKDKAAKAKAQQKCT